MQLWSICIQQLVSILLASFSWLLRILVPWTWEHSPFSYRLFISFIYTGVKLLGIQIFFNLRNSTLIITMWEMPFLLCLWQHLFSKIFCIIFFAGVRHYLLRIWFSLMCRLEMWIIFSYLCHLLVFIWEISNQVYCPVRSIWFFL